MITKLTDENKVEYSKGIMYMRLGNNFSDSINVYDGNEIEKKLGVINFMVKGKIVFVRGHERRVDGFVFEPTEGLMISCSTYSKIARYIYNLNEQFKEYLKIKQRGGITGNE
jgi:hypothetical protein